MKLKNLTGNSILAIAAITTFSLSGCQEKIPEELPNILWLTSEDNSALLGCYGDEFATTPNLDNLASEGFLYTHAYANAPVCAPARNTIITGIYATSGGNQHMRSQYPKSEVVKTYPEFLREAGYYCTNNSKTDYNTASINPSEIWDESSNQAHYKNRAPGNLSLLFSIPPFRMKVLCTIPFPMNNSGTVPTKCPFLRTTRQPRP
jgi:N-sulfoglucosamine sulfohydrolase